jgi:hypothetical protein
VEPVSHQLVVLLYICSSSVSPAISYGGTNMDNARTFLNLLPLLQALLKILKLLTRSIVLQMTLIPTPGTSDPILSSLPAYGVPNECMNETVHTAF